MILILDNIAAFVIGAAIFLTLMVVQLRSTELNIDQTSTYMMKNQATSLSTWIEEDVLNLGSNIDKAVSVPFENPTTDSYGNTTQFTFYRDTLNTSVVPTDTVRVSTRYTLTAAGYSSNGEDSTKVFQLNRSIRFGTGSWIKDGQSVPLISVFQVDMLDQNANTVASPATAMAIDPTVVRNTRVRFAMVPPIKTTRATLNRIFYGSTLLIPN
ncbi:MAG: hypothetical protein HKN13_05705 [Rhodothermales bacterium]|nr:hypothetical protein [Rhodothermales bacterium]